MTESVKEKKRACACERECLLLFMPERVRERKKTWKREEGEEEEVGEKGEGDIYLLHRKAKCCRIWSHFPGSGSYHLKYPNPVSKSTLKKKKILFSICQSF